MPLPGELWNVATGAWDRVPEEEIEDRVRAGTHAFGTGIKVPVVDSNGERWVIPSEDAALALTEGYQIETTADVRVRELREKYAGGSWNKIRAIAEEAGRVGTFGGTDVLSRAVGVEPEALAARKEALTTAETVGADVLGLVPSLFIPGSPVARVAQATTKVGKAAGAALNVAAKTGAARVATRALEAAVGTAVEGAAYSTGMVISEAALGDKDLTGSRIAGEIGLGVLTGGVLGIAGAAVGAGVSKFKGALAEVLDPEKISELAGKAAGRATGLAEKAKSLEAKGLSAGKLGEYALNHPQKALGGGSIMRTGADGAPARAIKARTMQKNAQLAMEEAGQRMEKLASEIPGDVDLGAYYRAPKPAKAAIPEQVVEEATGILDDMGRPITRQRVIPGTPAEPAVAAGPGWRVLDDLTDPVDKPLRDSIAAKLAEWSDEFADRGVVSFGRAVGHEQRVTSYMRNAYGKLSPNPAMDQAKRMRHDLNQHINERYAAEARRLGKDPDAWLKANTDYGWSKEIEKSAGDLARGREKTFFNLNDRLVAYGIGAPALAVSPAWAVSALGGAALSKMIREHGDQFLAAALDRVSKFDFLQRPAAAAEKRMKTAMSAATSKARPGQPKPEPVKLALDNGTVAVSDLAGLSKQPVLWPENLDAIRKAYDDGTVAAIPPIKLVKEGVETTVYDGHHRIAVARERGAERIAADVYPSTEAARASTRVVAEVPPIEAFAKKLREAAKAQRSGLLNMAEARKLSGMPAAEFDKWIQQASHERLVDLQIADNPKGLTGGINNPQRGYLYWIGAGDEIPAAYAVGRRTPAMGRQPAPAPSEPVARFDATVALIDRYAINPELLADTLDKSLATIQDVAPNVAASIAMRTARGIMYLHQEAPRPPKPANILSKPPPVSDAKRAVFEAQFRAVNEGPVSLLEDVGKGVLHPAAVAALEVVDPIGLEHARQEVLDLLAETGAADMDFDRLNALGVFLGVRLAATLEPSVVASLQAVHASQEAGRMAAGAMAKASIGSDLFASESEARERRRGGERA